MLIAWIAQGSRSSNSSRERAYARRPREGGLRRRQLSLSLSLSHRVPARDGDNEDHNVRIQETTAVEYLYAYL